MRLIDADGVIEEIKKQKLLAKEPATKKCIELIGRAATHTEPMKKCVEWIPAEEWSPLPVPYEPIN